MMTPIKEIYAKAVNSKGFSASGWGLGKATGVSFPIEAQTGTF
jgi:hypothetical protein